MRAFALFIAILLSLGTSATTQAAELHLNFRQFPAPVYTGRPAQLSWDYKVAPKEISFNNAEYEEIATYKWLHFAGHYLIVSINCGTSVECGVLVDRKTGRLVSKVPTTYAGWDYRSNSRLLVVNPYNRDDPPAIEYVPEEDRETTYWIWTGQKFDRIATEPWPQQ